MKKRIFYTNLHYRMQIQGVSDEQLALATRKSARTVSNWRVGRNRPSEKDMIFIAGYLNEDREFLFQFKK